MKAPRSASWYQAPSLEHAYALLLEARDHARIADCPKLLARIRAAISSAKGARRNMRHRRGGRP